MTENENILWLRYTILRRAINGLIEGDRKVCIDDLREICSEMDGKNLDELHKVHEKWIGY